MGSRLAILYNLREKSGPKIKNWQSYSNQRHLIPAYWRPSPVLVGTRVLNLVSLQL
jgi:hypothetical protein